MRLRRLLAVVGWLATVGEAPISEVSRRFSIPEDELVRELELAACCGLPPYSPGDLLEIIVTSETVEANLGRELARPRRLTAAEGFALAAAARTILAVPGADEDGSLAGALAKLDAALGDREKLVVDLDAPSLLADVRHATDDRRQLEIEYHSASSDETTRRVVDPLAVVSLDGHWYLDADCHRAGGLRRFRVDRIRSVRDLGPLPDGERPDAAVARNAFVPGPGALPVRLALGPGAGVGGRHRPGARGGDRDRRDGGDPGRGRDGLAGAAPPTARAGDPGARPSRAAGGGCRRGSPGAPTLRHRR